MAPGATAPGSVAADGAGRNGTYTKHLLANLAHPDTDILKVFQRTRAGVVKETGGRQTPWESTSLVGDFYFRPLALAASASTASDPSANDRAFWDSVKDSKSAGEYQAYLGLYPNGLFVALAQARLKALQAPTPAPSPPVQVATVAQNIGATVSPPAPGSLAAMGAGRVFRDCEDCPEMVVIPPGSFMMGSPSTEAQRLFTEDPRHNVTFSRFFAAGKFEVTFDEWNACLRDKGCDHRPSDPIWGEGRRPVIDVSWHDAKKYTEWLSRKTGKAYRLLTEAEWEYVARAGTTTAFHFGNTVAPNLANYNTTLSYAGSPTATSPGKTVPVGSYPANAFGLHDVHGNVSEWTEDCWVFNYNDAPSDGRAWISEDCGRRVMRGGAWNDTPFLLRSAQRTERSPVLRGVTIGFRLARTD